MGRTLVVERHDWETSGSGHQIQFPKAAFRSFFGIPGYYRFSIFKPPHRLSPSKVVTAKLSGYAKSATYRLNRILEIATTGPGFVLIEEAGVHGGKPAYDIWWFTGSKAASIARRRWKWRKAKDSQHGPGRRWTILRGPGPRRI
jgi:hypothetical protein